MVHLAAETYVYELTTTELIMAASLAVVILGGLMASARAHINRRVDLKLEESVQSAVARKYEIIETKLDTVLLNVRETSAAVGKVHELEVIIQNGLSTKVAAIEQTVDEIRGHLMWNGEERRQNA